jgi:S-formylglutathione hydrolase FrmB
VRQLIFVVILGALLAAWTHGNNSPYTVSNPPLLAGVTSSPSLPFTVTANVNFAGSQTITISDGAQGGTITPSVGSPGTSSVTVTPPIGTNSFTFTYAGPTAGYKTISFSNGQGWADPSPVSYYSATPVAPYDGTVWNNPDGPYPTGVTHATYHSNLMNVDVGYNIYLPPEYASQPATNFPVVYYFHGGLANENEINYQMPTVASLIAAGTIKPMIVVQINGPKLDHNRDAQPGSPEYGAWEPQTMFILEGIPWIDSHYRTIASKVGRAISGFSGGGLSCMRFAFIFPQLFGSAYCVAGAIDDVVASYSVCPVPADCSDVTVSEPTQLNLFYSNSTTAWMADSVWGYAVSNAANIKGLPIHVVVGSSDSLLAPNSDMMGLLDSLSISHTPMSTAAGCAHDYDCDWNWDNTNSVNSFIFASTYFTTAESVH